MFSMPSSPHADRPVFNQLDLKKIATDTKFVIRESKKFCPSCFIQSLLEAVITGRASLSQISYSMGGLVGDTMAKQAIHKRFGEASSDFLLAVYMEILEWYFASRSPSLHHQPFNRLLIADSSFNRIHGANTEHFRGNGNGRVDTAGYKIELVYDLLTGEMQSSRHYEAREQDKAIGKDLVDKVQAGDLVLRDLGYFAIKEFIRIEQVGAYWLSRLPLSTKVRFHTENGEQTLEQVLKSTSTRQKKVELNVVISNSNLPCRLVAVRADKSVAKQRRKERRKSGSEVYKETGLVRDGWHILITNIEVQCCSVQQLMNIYRMRWDVEIQFRAWKQSLKLHKAFDRDTSPHHIYALIIASMIHMLLLMISRRIAQQKLKPGQLSLEKLATSYSQFIIKADRFERCWDYPLDLRHLKKDSRKRKSPVAVGISSLS